MQARIVIPGRFVSLNEYIAAERRNRFMGAKIKRQETDRAAWHAKKCKARFKRPVMIGFDWYEPDRRRDVDNVVFAKKFLLDGLVNAGVLVDDSRRYVTQVSDTVHTDRDNARVEITITEMEEACRKSRRSRQK